MDWEGLGNQFSRWLQGNGGQTVYNAPVGPTVGGAPMAAGAAAGGGMPSMALAGPILQGLLGGSDSGGSGIPAAAPIPHTPGKQLQFPGLPGANPASIRNRQGNQ